MLEAPEFIDQQPGKVLRLGCSLTVNLVVHKSWCYKPNWLVRYSAVHYQIALCCLQQLCHHHHSSSCWPQEAKAQAISAKVVQCVVPLLSSANTSCRQLSCQVLASLAQLFQGRVALLQTDGIVAVVTALDSTANEAAACLQVCMYHMTLYQCCRHLP